MSRGRLSVVVPLFLALAAAGCLTASQQSRVQTDLDEVRKQVFEIQRDTASLVTKMDGIEQKLAKQDSASPTRWADLQAMLKTLADEIRSLGARVDDNTARVSTLSRDMTSSKDQYRALEARLAAIIGPSSIPGGAPPAPAPPQATPSAGPPPAGAGNPAAPATGSGSATGAAPPAFPAPVKSAAAAGVALVIDEAAQEEAFRTAYSDYTRGNYGAALAGFEGFVKRFPDSPLAGNAQYFAGECLFSQQEYQAASDAFTKAIQDYPESDKLAAAYLKKGLSLLALKQTGPGVVQLQHVIEAYPRSEEARIAADRLRQLGLRER